MASKRRTRKPSRSRSKSKSSFDKRLFIQCAGWGLVVFSFMRAYHMVSAALGLGVLVPLHPLFDALLLVVFTIALFRLSVSYGLPLFRWLTSL